VREIIGVNRIAIFLEEPPAATPASVKRPSNRLSCVCAVGVPHDVQNCIELTKRGGIGRWVTQSGRILRAENAASLQSGAEISRVQHEFDLLDCQVAIPINDRERTLGVALLGGHLTRPSFNDDELQLMFHLMEELGLSVKNSWLHSELTANNRLFWDVLSSLRSGNLVVGPDLEVLHVNPAMARLLRVNEDPDRRIVFADLPPPIAAKVHEVVENGRLADPFELDLSGAGGPYLRVSIIPLRSGEKKSLPQSAMVVVEDFTEVEQAKKLAVESANLQLTSLIAKRFAHEIRNSLVPLTTHLQLLDEQYGEPDFRASLRSSLARETGRITHFTEQMLFLAEPKFPPTSVISIEKLVREAFARAQQLSPADSSLALRGPSEGCTVTCHPQALRHALLEIFANSLQSAPSPVEVVLEINVTGDAGLQRVSLAFRDSGPGFSPETASRATEAFYTTRTTGAGLGLTVARKVVSGLGGDLEIRPRHKDSPFDLILSLPSKPSYA
jgi:signal transduction histidine kinase